MREAMSTDSHTTDLLPSIAAAAYLNLKAQTLRAWRLTGEGPTFVRYTGRRGPVFYERAELERFVKERSYRSTSEESEAARRPTERAHDKA
jgi:hypothetical protein